MTSQQQNQSRILTVQREDQNDNACGEGWRECFTSSCAAIARFWGRCDGDDAYDRIRSRYGDTTNPQAQIRALAELGLTGHFVTNGTPDLIRREIDAGRPLAVGWIHKGAIPHGLYGQGHWSVVSGYTPLATVQQDPNGEADLIAGGYLNHTGGRNVNYSWKNWRQRWELVQSGRGWRFSPGNGWAMLVFPPGQVVQ